MKVLSIGNSFSEDAQAYLKGVCDAAGVEILCANLYIGGCTLVEHYKNHIKGLSEYSYVVNGVSTGKHVSLEEGLRLEEWDVITFQESSSRSGEIHHFEPYIYELIAFAKTICPKAKIALHETWGYSTKLLSTMKKLGFYSPLEMFDQVEETYKEVFKRCGADIFIPSGSVMRRLFVEGYNTHYDGQHASRGIGRYALALTWLRVLFGVKVSGNSFSDFEIFVSREEKEAAWAAVDAIEV